MHNDASLWESPEKFRPERFLTPEGRYQSSDLLAPFSVGKRVCPGETLARMELFLFFVGIMQTFSVRLEDPKADVEAIAKGVSGITRVPGPHRVVLTRREA